MATVDPVAAATYFVSTLGFTAFPVWGSKAGVCSCGDPHDGTGKYGPDNVGKHPAVSGGFAHGFQDATADLSRIRTFLKNPGTPNYGLNAPDGVFAMDVDGPEGLARWEELERLYGQLPVTLTTLTAHGRHYFFHWPAGTGLMPKGKLFGFVVRRHDDGYVIGPGSVHPLGVVYDTLRQPDGHPYDIAELPTGWVEAVERASRPQVVLGGPDALPAVGERHDWLRNRARHYRGVIDDPAVLKAAVMAENARLPDPKTEAEVDRAIGEVFTKFGLDPIEEVEERAARKLGGDELDLLDTPASGVFPLPPDRVAFSGLLGECVEDLATGTDASMAGLLGSMLAFSGALIPGWAYFARDQMSAPFIALVGESSIGRKGTAMTRVMDAMSHALEMAVVHRIVLDGINSGEGLVTTLYYKREHFPHEPTVGLVFEEEYATLLASRGREGSNLDPKMRQAFDGGPLSNRRSGETKTVMPPYWLPALIGITPVELRQRLEPAALQSGSANRWLYLPVVKRDIVPTNDLPRFADEHRAALVEAHRAAMKTPRLLQVELGVKDTLHEYADFLPTATDGLARDLTRRLSVIAFRIALVHAIVERSVTVTVDHLRRALALTEYARRGIDWVFGETIGNPDANLLFRHLSQAGRLTRNTITRQIIRDPIRHQAAVDELLRLGRARVARIPTGGRDRTELVSTAEKGAFVPFYQGLDIRTSESGQNRGRKDKSAQPAGEKVDESGTKGGRNGTKGLDEFGVDERPDESRTEVQMEAYRTRPATWASPCHFYVNHQSAHRLTADGWVCDICSEGNP